VKDNNLFLLLRNQNNKLDWMARPWTKFVEVQLGAVFKTNCKFFFCECGVAITYGPAASSSIFFNFPSWKLSSGYVKGKPPLAKP
jgi:hypothetical protein